MVRPRRAFHARTRTPCKGSRAARPRPSAPSPWRRSPKEHEDVSLLDEARITIDEARVVLPGIQALFGFQLIAVLSERFGDLDALDRDVHLLALVLVAVAVVLIMTPAAYHRMAERGRVTREFVDLASALISLALFPLVVGIALDVYLVSWIATESTPASIAIAAALLALGALSWFVLPWRRRVRGHQGTSR